MAPARTKPTTTKTKARPSRGGAKTNAMTIAAKMRAAKALELRKEGETFEAIAQKAGYKSKQAAWDAVRRALAEVIREPAEELIRLDLERLDAMWGVNYLNAQGGDPVALQACLKIMERRARLLGLDAPQKMAATTPEGEQANAAPVLIALPPALSVEEWQQTFARPGS